MLWSRVYIISLSETHGVKPMCWKSKPLKMNVYFRTHYNWVGGFAQCLGLCVRNPPQNFIHARLVGPTQGISLLGQRPHGCHVIKYIKNAHSRPSSSYVYVQNLASYWSRSTIRLVLVMTINLTLGNWKKKKEVEKILNSYKSQMWDIPIQGRMFIFRILPVDAP